jgi:hypothetical protein
MKAGRTVAIILFSSFAAVTLSAQQPPPPAAGMEKPGMMDGKKMDESMMAHHKEMMARMEAMDTRLDELVKKMNAATGSRKADAVAAVVNELVVQRKQMREHMMAMQPEMMKHMMGHMHAGMMKGMMESMSECPMMKGMAGPPTEPKKPTEEHSKHHPE